MGTGVCDSPLLSDLFDLSFLDFSLLFDFFLNDFLPSSLFALPFRFLRLFFGGFFGGFRPMRLMILQQQHSRQWKILRLRLPFAFDVDFAAKAWALIRVLAGRAVEVCSRKRGVWPVELLSRWPFWKPLSSAFLMSELDGAPLSPYSVLRNLWICFIVAPRLSSRPLIASDTCFRVTIFSPRP